MGPSSALAQPPMLIVFRDSASFARAPTPPLSSLRLWCSVSALPATCGSPLRAHGKVRCELPTSTSGSPSVGHAISLILPPSLEHSRAYSSIAHLHLISLGAPCKLPQCDTSSQGLRLLSPAAASLASVCNCRTPVWRLYRRSFSAQPKLRRANSIAT